MATILSLEELQERNVLYHKKERLNFNSSETFRQRLEEYPLDRDFVDWAVKEGYIVIYEMEEYLDGEADFRRRLIKVIGLGTVPFDALEFVLAHELIHVSTPNLITGEEGKRFGHSKKGIVYEDIINEFAEKYVSNRPFMNYIHQIIPREVIKPFWVNQETGTATRE